MVPVVAISQHVAMENVASVQSAASAHSLASALPMLQAHAKDRTPIPVPMPTAIAARPTEALARKVANETTTTMTTVSHVLMPTWVRSLVRTNHHAATRKPANPTPCAPAWTVWLGATTAVVAHGAAVAATSVGAAAATAAKLRPATPCVAVALCTPSPDTQVVPGTHLLAL